jgi:hypothetical protein
MVSLTVNTWVHVAVTYDKTTGFARLYRNGLLVKELDVGVFTPQTSYPLQLGAQRIGANPENSGGGGRSTGRRSDRNSRHTHNRRGLE